MNLSFKIFCLLLACLMGVSCNHHQEQVLPVLKNQIPWDKITGKIVAFDSYYAFVANSETQKIDTILKQPSYLRYGQFYLYGGRGISYSKKENLLLFTLDIFTLGIYGFDPSLQSISLNGSNQAAVPLGASWIQSPVENSDGSIAYLVQESKYSSSIASLWVDQKKLFTFSVHKVTPIYYLDWHPSNEFLLLGLLDDNEAISFPSLTEINATDSSQHVVLEAKPSTLYYCPHYSPDGSKIAFVLVDDLSYSICTINRDGTGFKKLTDKDVSDSYVTWSPDGSKLAYTARGKGIYVINADGTDDTLVFKGDPNKWVGSGLIWLP